MTIHPSNPGRVVANLFHNDLAPMPPGAPPSSAAPGAEVESLKADIERLLMVTEALWTMLKDQFEYTDEHLVQRITEIDARDGKVDGRVGKEAPHPCPQCQRPAPRRAPVCLYCGASLPPRPFAR